MKNVSEFIVVLVTADTKKGAEKIAKALLNKRLAACVNIVPGLTSFFRWKGKTEKANEFLLVIKTQSGLFAELEKTVKANHNYSVPEIIAMPIIKGSKDYLGWIQQEISQKLSKK